jgi:hypothetical protein
MALWAQSQCARSLEVLAALKNPPVVTARQANVTTGPQQNNFDVPSSGETEIKQTQLSESIDELRQNTGTPRLKSSPNSSLEAVGEIDRAKIDRGESEVCNASLQGRSAAPTKGAGRDPARDKEQS